MWAHRTSTVEKKTAILDFSMSTSNHHAAALCPTAGVAPRDESSCSTPGAPHGQAACEPAPPASQPGVQQNSTTVTSMQMELCVDLGTIMPTSASHGTGGEAACSNHHQSSNRLFLRHMDGAEGAQESVVANASTSLQHQNLDGTTAPANMASREFADASMEAPLAASNASNFAGLGSAVFVDEPREHPNATTAAKSPVHRRNIDGAAASVNMATPELACDQRVASTTITLVFGGYLLLVIDPSSASPSPSTSASPALPSEQPPAGR